MYLRSEISDWVHIERQAVPLHTLDFLLCSHKKLRPPILAPAHSHSFSLWDNLSSHPPLVSSLKPLAHLFRDPLFPPGLEIKAFRWWLKKGLYRISNFLRPLGPLTKAYCISKLDMLPSELFCFTQIFNYLNKLWSSTSEGHNITAYEKWCGQAMEQTGGISVIYRVLSLTHSKTHYMLAWEADLAQKWDLEVRHRASLGPTRGY